MAEDTRPDVHDIDGVLAHAAEWLARGDAVGLATVVRTWGSSPRPAGSKLAVVGAGQFVGSVSGGCIEGAVITEALEVAAGREKPHVLSFGVSDERAWEVGLACGGKIEVFVDAASPSLVAELREARAKKQPVVTITPLTGTGSARIARATDELDAAVRDAIEAATRTDQTLVVETPEGAVLVEPHNPPTRLVIIGAVHVAEPLAKMARIAGFAVTIVDPRRAWATPERFPSDTLVVDWPDVAMDALAIDARTAIVALTHDPKIDDPGLIAALRSPAFYIGCLGSTKTHAARRARLGAQFDEAALARLHGPVGLAIGAKSPSEIAVSILAEIIATLRGRDPRA